MSISRQRISTSLLYEISASLAQGENVALIAPKHGGKGYILKTVEARLLAIGLQTYYISFESEKPLSNMHEAFDFVTRQLPENLRSEGDPSVSLTTVVDKIRSERIDGRSSVLVLAKLDSLRIDIARAILLQMAQMQDEVPPYVSLLVPCESPSFVHFLLNSRDISTSFSRTILLQGFDKDLFVQSMDVWIGKLKIPLSSEERIADLLYESTNGNTSLMRRILYSYADSRGYYTDSERTADMEILQRHMDRLLALGPQGAIFFQYAAELIASRPEIWTDLEDLIELRSIPLMSGEPSYLELAGVAVEQQGRLVIASTYIEQFLRRHFGRLQMADLYCLEGRWEEGLSRYKSPGEAQVSKPRPLNFHDSLVVRAILRRLYFEFEKPGSDLKALVMNALRFVLGFAQVSFWRNDPKTGWFMTTGFSPSADLARALRSFHASSPAGQVATITNERGERIGQIVLLEASGDLGWNALAVADLANAPALEEQRDELLQEVVRQFNSARTRATDDLRQQQLKLLEKGLSDIATGIFEGLFVRLFNPNAVLQAAADHLIGKDLGFSRASFALVDLEGGSLDFVCSAPADRRPQNDRLSLEQSPAISMVLSTQQPIVVSALTDWGEAERFFLQQLSARAALVPIILEKQDAIGILCVEQRSTLAIGSKECEALARFGSQIAAAIVHSRRLSLLDDSLNQLPDPILIVNRTFEKEYGNSAAQRIFPGLQRGWSVQKVFDDTQHAEVLRILKASTSEKHRVMEFAPEANRPGLRRAVIACPLGSNRRGEATGALVHFQDQSYYREILDAYSVLESATSVLEALERVQNVFSSLGATWIRSYRIEGSMMIPDACTDIRRPKVKQLFENRKSINLPLRGVDPLTWMAVTTGKPHVFCYDPTKETAALFYTEKGLPVRPYQQPPEEKNLDKRPGDFWIDFPLKQASKVFGKITVPCGERFECNLSPEGFEMYRVFADLAGEVLDRIHKDRLRGSTLAHQAWVDSQQIVADAHAPLVAVRARYDALEMQDFLRGSDLEPINRDFASTIEGILRTTGAAKGAV